MMVDEIIKGLPLEILLKIPLGKEAEKAMKILESVQENLLAFSDKKDEMSLTIIKSGTILVLAVLKKIASGKLPIEFDEADWAEIVRGVSDFAIQNDNQKYSELVFLMYAEYIDFYASLVECKVSKSTVEAIRSLADALHEKTEALRSGNISEVVYIEKCLWISLDAIIKMLASLVNVVAGEYAGELAQAVTTLAFEYGRYQLFRKKQDLLTDLLAQQNVLDKELQDKYDFLIKDLHSEAEHFMNLVDLAFAPNFEELLINSTKLAKHIGVSELEVLDSLDKVDTYFLD